ncbi:MAG: D-tyrosyl-tRNA(Tyr) deacylase [Clostridia bacterium]|nr:D-tyrosyl-tRNA(Tyr) deacylase [Clostridia bacterium]
MKALLQRVLSAELKIDGVTVGKIDKGLLVYLGFTEGDDKGKVDYVMDRIGKIRIFEDEAGKINLDLLAVGGNVMLVPNFTLYAETKASRRPSFSNALRPDLASELFDYALKTFDEKFFHAERGVFGADMKITSIADGPINVIIEK